MAKGKMKGVTFTETKGVRCYYATINGKRTYCGKGNKGEKIAEAARSKYVAKRYENLEVGAGLKVRKPDFRTVKELANWYMTLPSIQEQKSYQNKVCSVGHLLEFFGNKKVDQVEIDDQERYRTWREGQGAANGTVDIEIMALSAMYHKAQKAKKIHADAVPGQFITKNDRNPRRLITDDEYESLCKHDDDDFRDVLVAGFESAMRSSEIANLTANQVHLNVQHISGAVVDYIDLGIFDTKNKTMRTVPVSPILKEILERRLDGLGPEDHVFGDGRKYTKIRISWKFAQLCGRAGVTHGDKSLNGKGERVGVVFHCLRYTRTTKWVEAGYSDEIVRRATGHKSLAAYQTYIRLDPSVVMRLVQDQRKEEAPANTYRSQY
jgi:integrase